VETNLVKWRALVVGSVGQEGGEIRSEKLKGYTRHYFDVKLSDAHREKLMEHWYANSGTGTDATSRHFRWNDCITFEEMDCISPEQAILYCNKVGGDSPEQTDYHKRIVRWVFGNAISIPRKDFDRLLIESARVVG
jgi:hypothetical protein